MPLQIEFASKGGATGGAGEGGPLMLAGDVVAHIVHEHQGPLAAGVLETLGRQ